MGTPIAFIKAINDLAPNDNERLRVLSVKRRTLTEYKAGRIPKFARFLMHHPDLLEALLEDAKAGRANGNHDTPIEPSS